MFGCSVHDSIACKLSSVLSSVRSMFVYDAASLPVVLAVLLLLKPFDSLLQLLHHALQDHGELLIIEGHILSRPGSLSCTWSRPGARWPARPGPRSRCGPCPLRFCRKAAALQLLVRDGLVLLEGPVAQVDEGR